MGKIVARIDSHDDQGTAIFVHNKRKNNYVHLKLLPFYRNEDSRHDKRRLVGLPRMEFQSKVESHRQARD